MAHRMQSLTPALDKDDLKDITLKGTRQEERLHTVGAMGRES